MTECSRCFAGSAMRRLVAVVLVASVPTSIARAQQAQGAVKGVVLDSLGGAVSSAHVVIEGSGARLVTDSDGAFRFTRVPAGEAKFRVRRLGYRPAVFQTQVQSGTETKVEFRLGALAMPLPTVEIRSKAEVYDQRLAGFHARKDKNVGHFITRESLDRHDSPRFADVLRRVPGITVRPLRRSGGGTTVSMRGKCSPLVFIDGFPAAAGPVDLELIDLASVEGIEIYAGLATVPPEFMSVRGGERCGVIAVWSRPYRPRQRRLSSAGTGDLERKVETASVYTAAEVDETAALTPGTAEPAYPDTFWGAGVAGRVVAEFIVDGQGGIESGSFGIVSSSHPIFSAAVKSALETANFRAARLDGRAVRQLVQLPFEFNPPDNSPAPPPPR